MQVTSSFTMFFQAKASPARNAFAVAPQRTPLSVSARPAMISLYFPLSLSLEFAFLCVDSTRVVEFAFHREMTRPRACRRCVWSATPPRCSKISLRNKNVLRDSKKSSGTHKMILGAPAVPS